MDCVRIAICEDCMEIRQLICSFLQQYHQEFGENFEITSFSTGEELVDGWKQFDILLLDIDLPGIDGISAAKKLEQLYSLKTCHIIMVSGLPERFQETYRIMAKDFVIKPIEKEKFFDALDYAIRCINMNSKVVIYRKRIPYQIYEKDIYYIKAMGNYCRVTTSQGYGDVNETMTTLEDTLSHKIFVRCHRSYLVNVLYIENISTKGIKLITKEIIPISRGHLAEIKNRISQIGLT